MTWRSQGRSCLQSSGAPGNVESSADLSRCALALRRAARPGFLGFCPLRLGSQQRGLVLFPLNFPCLPPVLTTYKFVSLSTTGCDCATWQRGDLSPSLAHPPHSPGPSEFLVSQRPQAPLLPAREGADCSPLAGSTSLCRVSVHLHSVRSSAEWLCRPVSIQRIRFLTHLTTMNRRLSERLLRLQIM